MSDQKKVIPPPLKGKTPLKSKPPLKNKTPQDETMTKQLNRVDINDPNDKGIISVIEIVTENTGTIIRRDVDIQNEAKNLTDALTKRDPEEVMNILTKLTNDQRLLVAESMKSQYGKNLSEEIKKAFKGNFEKVLVALVTDPMELQAKELHDAIKGAGTDERTLSEILFLHSPAELKRISSLYETKYKHSLEQDIKEDTSSSFKHFLVTLLNAKRFISDSEFNAVEDAKQILRGGVLCISPNNCAFNEILCNRNSLQLQQIFKEYQNITDHSIKAAISKKYTGDGKESLLDFINFVENKPRYLAERLHKSMKGLGTKDNQLIRLVVSRSEIDMELIKKEYNYQYKTPLANSIKDDTSGDYKKCLLKLIGEA